MLISRYHFKIFTKTHELSNIPTRRWLLLGSTLYVETDKGWLGGVQLSGSAAGAHAHFCPRCHPAFTTLSVQKAGESTCCHQYSQRSIYILRMNNAPEVNPSDINPDQMLTGHFSVSLLLQLLTLGLST